MNNIEKLNIEKLQEEINSEELRSVKIITTALNIGVLLYFAVCLFLYFSDDHSVNPETIDTSLNDNLLLGVLGLTAIMIVVSRIVPNKVFNKDGEAMTSFLYERAANSKEAVQIINTFYIIKFAMLEGVALFGLVALMLSVLNSSIYNNDIYWLAIIPMLLMNTIFILNFPTKERVIQLISDKILSQNF